MSASVSEVSAAAERSDTGHVGRRRARPVRIAQLRGAAQGEATANEDGEGDVHAEDPTPVQRAGEHTADEDADAGDELGGGTPVADGEAPRSHK